MEMRKRPLSLAELNRGWTRPLVGVFCDIDDTLTAHGRLVPEAYVALSKLMEAGLRVVPVTGRPAGWVDQIARIWPISGCVGENGGLWSWHNGSRLQTRFLQSAETRRANRQRLTALGAAIQEAIPGTALASDQQYRALDLAVDFCEDVPRLPAPEIERIVAMFRDAGATCKVSSIHVNGWFGSFDKRTGCERLVRDIWDEPLDSTRWAYVGDSANDEPMFKTFRHAFGVANVEPFLAMMEHWPTYMTQGEGGYGFAEVAQAILDDLNR